MAPSYTAYLPWAKVTSGAAHSDFNETSSLLPSGLELSHLPLLALQGGNKADLAVGGERESVLHLWHGHSGSVYAAMQAQGE